MEFALLLPFILFLFTLGADWCRIYYVAHTLNECARSGAFVGSGIAYQQRAMVNSEREASAKETAVNNGADLNPPVHETDVAVAIDGSYITVTVGHDFQAIVPYLGNGGTWRVSRSVRMPLLP